MDQPKPKRKRKSTGRPRGRPVLSERVAKSAIRADEAYTLAQFCHRTGMSRDAVIAMEGRGLKTTMEGNRKMITGQAYLHYLNQRAGLESYSSTAAS